MAAPFDFSVSHTEHWVAVALADRPVGVDVERCDPGPLRQAAPAFLHPVEAPTPDALLPALWTGKEAVAKAAGTGFAGHDPSAFAFVVAARRRPRLHTSPDGGDYRVCGLRPDARHLLAVAVSAGPRGAHDAQRAGLAAQPGVGELHQQAVR